MVDKLPIRIVPSFAKPLLLFGKSGFFDWRIAGKTVDAHDAAARRLDQPPLHFARDWIAIDFSQVTLHRKEVGVVLLGGEPPEAIRGREDGDALVAAEHAQVGIARDDRLGACGQGAGEDVDVFGIA